MAGMSGSVEKVPGWESLPGAVRARFLEADLPPAVLKLEDSVNFQLGPELVEAGGGMRFGHGTGLFEGDFCLDSATGTVRLMRPDGLPPLFVNSSLEQFGRSARQVLAHERDLTRGDAETCANAAKQVRSAIAIIDPAADDTDTYWDALYYELADGTYSDFE